MSILDKLKTTGQSAKEYTIISALSPAMQLIDGWTKDIHPQNEISKFIGDKYSILFETQDEKTNGIMALLTKMAIAEANANPEFVEHKMLRFYNEFRVWYKEYLMRKDINDECKPS